MATTRAARLTDAQRALLWRMAADPEARIVSTAFGCWVEDANGAVAAHIRVKATIAALRRRVYIELDRDGVLGRGPAFAGRVLRLTDEGRRVAAETAEGGRR